MSPFRAEAAPFFAKVPHEVHEGSGTRRAVVSSPVASASVLFAASGEPSRARIHACIGHAG
jgi:hypothetical protein